MSAQIRICPHCGAGVVGATTICPRCDQPLEGYNAETAGLKTNPQQWVVAPNKAELDVFEGRQPEMVEEDTRQQIPYEIAPSPEHPPEMPDFENALTAALPMQAPVTPPPPLPTPPVIPPSHENAVTAPVPAEMVGVTRPPTPKSSVPAVIAPAWQTPPPPYTPPPLVPSATVSVVPYSYPSNYYLQQRLSAYQQGGYQLQSQSPYQVVLAYGKPLSLIWWLLAMVSGVGLMWYFLILLSSSFSKDRVYLVIERDGALYEDGAGAAHVRRKRARVGQRWGFTGVVIFFISLIWFVGMVLAGVVGISNYREELQAAYPTISLFVTEDEPGTTTALNPDNVSMVESGVLAYSILFVLSVLGILSGLTLIIVGYLHSAAYQVDVPPLPEYI